MHPWFKDAKVLLKKSARHSTWKRLSLNSKKSLGEHTTGEWNIQGALICNTLTNWQKTKMKNLDIAINLLFFTVYLPQKGEVFVRNRHQTSLHSKHLSNSEKASSLSPIHSQEGFLELPKFLCPSTPLAQNWNTLTMLCTSLTHLYQKIHNSYSHWQESLQLSMIHRDTQWYLQSCGENTFP